MPRTIKIHLYYCLLVGYLWDFRCVFFLPGCYKKNTFAVDSHLIAYIYIFVYVRHGHTRKFDNFVSTQLNISRCDISSK